MSILDRLFGPENGTLPSQVVVGASRAPFDHDHEWYQREAFGMTYWECIRCYEATAVPPDDE